MKAFEIQLLRISLLCGLLIGAVVSYTACGGGGSQATVNVSGTPTDAYKELYAAVKAKNIEQIKGLISKKTVDLAEMASQQQKKPIESVLENGFSASTFAPALPEIRDERVKGQYGAVEVWNSKDSLWEDVPFVVEDGRWKLAYGDQFAGSFKSPGKPRSMLEREAANLANPQQVESLNVNMNMKPGTKVKMPPANRPK